MGKSLVGKTANGFNVYANIGKNLPVSYNLLKEALEYVEYTPDFWIGTVNLQRDIGKTKIVKIADVEEWKNVFYCNKNSLLIHGDNFESTSNITICIYTDIDTLVTVLACFLGPLAEEN